MLSLYIHSHAHSLVFSTPMWFRYSCISVFLVTLQALLLLCPSCNAIYDCDLISKWPGWPQVFLHLSLDQWPAAEYEFWQHASMPFGMSIHSIVLVVLHMPGISLSPFYGGVWMVNLWWIAVVSGYIVFLSFTGELLVVFLIVCVIGLQHFAWILLTTACNMYPNFADETVVKKFF